MNDDLQRTIDELRSRMGSERDPQSRAFAPLADAYRRSGELDRAVELLEEGLRRLPDFATGHLVEARVRRVRGEVETAEEAYRRVLELDPENVEALRGLGELLAGEGRTEEALRRLREVEDLEPGDPDLRDRIRALAARRAELAPGPVELPHEEGVREKEEIRTRTMAEIFFRQGHRERALEILDHLVEESPGDSSLRERRDELRARIDSPEVDEAGEEESEGEETETLAREWSEGPAPADDLSTPFAWSGEEGEGEEGAAPPSDPDDEPIRTYFKRMLAWTSEEEVVRAPAEEARDAPVEPTEEVVPVESLAPDLPPGTEVVAIESLAPDLPPGTEVVPIESLAPDSAGGPL